MADWKKNKTRGAAFKSWFGDWERDPANASKVVDQQGSPKETGHIKVVYHGTRSKFDAFSKDRVSENEVGTGFYFAEDKAMADLYASMAWKGTGKPRVIAAYLSIKKPFDFDKQISAQDLNAILAAAAEQDPAAAKKMAGSFRKLTRNGGAHGGSIWWEMRKHLQAKLEPWDTSDGGVNEILGAAGFDGVGYTASDEMGTAVFSPKKKGEFGRVWITFSPEQIKSVDNRGTFDPKNPKIRESLEDDDQWPIVSEEWTPYQGDRGGVPESQAGERDDAEVARRAGSLAESDWDENLHPRGQAGRWATKGHAQTTSPEFKDWFGDWEANPAQASKVVDKAGNPLRLFHGTSADFTEFGSPQDALSAIGWHYFSDNPAFAEKFAGSEQPLDYEVNPEVPKPPRPEPDAKSVIQERLDDGTYREREVDAWTTAADGLVATASTDVDYVTLTHARSGLALGPSVNLAQAKWLAGKLAEFNVDWTQDADAMMGGMPAEDRKQVVALARKARWRTEKDEEHAAANVNKIDPLTLQWKSDATGEGSRVMPVFLNLRNPLDLTSLKARKPSLKQFVALLNERGIGMTMRDFPFSGRDLYQMLNDTDVAEKLRRKALEAGYDGIVFKDFYDPKTKGTSYIAFSGEQVKSASGNRGSFDPTRANINESEALEAVSSWVPYQGPKGGKGWQNTNTGKVDYVDDKPGQRGAATPAMDWTTKKPAAPPKTPGP